MILLFAESVNKPSLLTDLRVFWLTEEALLRKIEVN